MTWFKKIQEAGYPFPNSYIVFDLETTGLDNYYDYILPIGITNVIDGEIRDNCTTILDWAKYSKNVLPDVRKRLSNTMYHVRHKRKLNPISIDRMLKVGKEPIHALAKYYEFFDKCKEDNIYMVAHNGIYFDTVFLQNHFKRFLDIEFTFNPNHVLDTGLLEKGSQHGIQYSYGKELVCFYNSIKKAPNKGVHWALDSHCIPKYSLDKKYNLDVSKAHTADFDCKATHVLFKEYRALALGV